MKEKIVVIIEVVIVLLLIIGVMYAVDVNRIRKNKPVIFGTWGYCYTHPINIIEDDVRQSDEVDEKEEHSFIGTVLEEDTTYMIVEPNEDEDERKSADKIVINYGVDHIDYLYGIGRKVLITYTGGIMETYPAQINTDNVSVEGYEEFEISVKRSDEVKAKKILNNKDLNGYGSDYDLYYYGLDEINVKVDNKEMPLEEALRSGKVTIDKIISNANGDLDAKKITGDTYKDGGSTIYKYGDYTIIKCHTLDGNRDVWIGITEMTINDID